MVLLAMGVGSHPPRAGFPVEARAHRRGIYARRRNGCRGTYISQKLSEALARPSSSTIGRARRATSPRSCRNSTEGWPYASAGHGFDLDQPQLVQEARIRSSGGFRGYHAGHGNAVSVRRASLPAGTQREGIHRPHPCQARTVELRLGRQRFRRPSLRRMFASMAQLNVVHVPYKGSAPSTTAILSGETIFMFDNIVTTLPLAHAGKLRALAVTTAVRSAAAPEMPTISESGVPGYDANDGSASSPPRARRRPWSIV